MGNPRNRVLLTAVVVVALLALLASACQPAKPAEKQSVRIGFVTSKTGPYAEGDKATQSPNYYLWRDQVNAKGGLEVKGVGKRLPVEFVEYDDKSDMETVVRLFEKLITDDKVDLVLPPWGTAHNVAVAPIADKYGYPIMGGTAIALTLEKMNSKHFFGLAPKIADISQGLVDMLLAAKAQAPLSKVALVNVADTFGIEVAQFAGPKIKAAGFDMVIEKSYPLGVADLSPLLKEAMSKGVEAWVGIAYPPDSFLITKQAMELNFNPRVMYLAVGPQFAAYKQAFGANADGIFGSIFWAPHKAGPKAKEYLDAHVKAFGYEPDRGASAYFFASLQALEQAIGRVGLDRDKITQELATKEFPNTVVGTLKFKNNWITPVATTGQWQKGQSEVITPKEAATATLITKPSWTK